MVNVPAVGGASVNNGNEVCTGICEDYRGKQSFTKSGYPCREWNALSYNANSGVTDGNGNYCRNPDADSGGIWCYTIDRSVTYGYCQPL